MSIPRRGDAAFRYTLDGATRIHYLGHPLHRPTAEHPETVFQHVSADFSTTRRVRITSSVADLRAIIRWDGSGQSLADFLKAARAGASLEYFPSLANPSESYPCELVSADQIGPDSDFWWNERYATQVHLRRTDGGSWQGLVEGTLFYYRAGNDVPGLTFSRTGTARYLDELGVMQEAADGIQRTSWLHQFGLAEPVYLGERASTNEFLHSEDLNNAAWSKVNASINTNLATGPDGVVSLDSMIEDSTAAANHGVSQAVTGMTADAVHVFSGWFKANTRSWVRLQFQETAASANFVRAWFDLATGAVGTTAAGGTAALERAYIEDWTHVEPDLYRCVVVGSVGNGATALTGFALMATGNGLQAYNGDGTSSIFAGYLQFEDDKHAATSYIPTTTTPATRNADLLYATYPHSPRQSITGYLSFVELGTHAQSADGSLGLLHIGSESASTDPRLLVYNNTGSGYAVAYDNGVAGQNATYSAATPTIGQLVELRFVFDYDPETHTATLLIGQSIEGGAEGTAVYATPMDVPSSFAGSLVYFNSLGNSNIGLNAIRTAKIAPGVKTMSEMRAL